MIDFSESQAGWSRLPRGLLLPAWDFCIQALYEIAWGMCVIWWCVAKLLEVMGARK